MTIFKNVAIMLDAETGEPIGGLTSMTVEAEPKQGDTLFVGDRVFDVLDAWRVKSNMRLGDAYPVRVSVFAVISKERFMMPQERGASLTPHQREMIVKPWWKRLFG